MRIRCRAPRTSARLRPARRCRTTAATAGRGPARNCARTAVHVSRNAQSAPDRARDRRRGCPRSASHRPSARRARSGTRSAAPFARIRLLVVQRNRAVRRIFGRRADRASARCAASMRIHSRSADRRTMPRTAGTRRSTARETREQHAARPFERVGRDLARQRRDVVDRHAVTAARRHDGGSPGSIRRSSSVGKRKQGHATSLLVARRKPGAAGHDARVRARRPSRGAAGSRGACRSRLSRCARDGRLSGRSRRSRASRPARAGTSARSNTVLRR